MTAYALMLFFQTFQLCKKKYLQSLIYIVAEVPEGLQCILSVLMYVVQILFIANLPKIQHF